MFPAGPVDSPAPAPAPTSPTGSAAAGSAMVDAAVEMPAPCRRGKISPRGSNPWAARWACRGCGAVISQGPS
eukprot:9929925-Alexandrium_andersonii.AAC.1